MIRNTAFSPVNFTSIRGVFNAAQLRLAVQTQILGDGTVLATFSDSVLTAMPELRDIPPKRETQPETFDPVVSFAKVPVVEDSIVGRQATIRVYENQNQRGRPDSRKLRSEFRGKITEENSAYFRILSELDSGNPHRISERELFPKTSARLVEVNIS